MYFTHQVFRQRILRFSRASPVLLHLNTRTITPKDNVGKTVPCGVSFIHTAQ